MTIDWSRRGESNESQDESPTLGGFFLVGVPFRSLKPKAIQLEGPFGVHGVRESIPVPLQPVLGRSRLGDSDSMCFPPIAAPCAGY